MISEEDRQDTMALEVGAGKRRGRNRESMLYGYSIDLEAEGLSLEPGISPQESG